MNEIRNLLAGAFITSLPALCPGAGNQLAIKAVNQLQLTRSNVTIELSAKDLAPLGEKNLSRIHVKDAAGREVVCQAVETEGDYRTDQVIFQADFTPGESKTFCVFAGEKQVYFKDQFRAYGRLVQERSEDFAWENDRIAHRMYGKALETFQNEPLCSSTVDVWSKRTTRLVINDWYLLDNYHEDNGDGADFYSAGVSRGNGGNGLWAGDRLWVSRNFKSSRVLACGPIRVMFELTYDPFEVNGISVSEVKRVTLDAGQNLDHYQSFYKPYMRPGKRVTLITGIGLRKVDIVQKDLNAEGGCLTAWEPVKEDTSRTGHWGSAVLVEPKLFERLTEDKLNLLMLVKVPENNVSSYWAGYFWDASGQFTDYAAWKKHVDEFAQGLASPIEVTIQTEASGHGK